MPLFRLLAIVVALLIAPANADADADAEAQSWGWFVAKSTPGGWGTESGKVATVLVNGDEISIELKDADGWRHRLSGKKVGSRINVKLTTNETDLVDYPLSGKYTRKAWKPKYSDSVGRENIELVGAGIVVGLTREIQ